MSTGIDFRRKAPWSSEKAARDVKQRKNEPVPLTRDGAPISMLNVRHNECRWISGEPTADSPMCGHPTEPGHAYCLHHKSRSQSNATWRPR